MTRTDGPRIGVLRASRLSALIVALSFAVQIFAFVLSTNGRVAFATGADNATVTASAEFCKAPGGHGGGTPASHHHCSFCSTGDRDTSLDGAWSGPAVPARLSPMPVGGMLFVGEAPARRPAGWLASWSSRAPPLPS